MLRAELIKLKRSSLWVIAVILPLLAVTTGSLNYWGNREVLDQAWASLFGQVFPLLWNVSIYPWGWGCLRQPPGEWNTRAQTGISYVLTLVMHYRSFCAKSW